MTYEEACAAHAWQVPERYNIAADVCDKHPRDKLAMIHEDPDGAVREVRWGELQDMANRFALPLLARTAVVQRDPRGLPPGTERRAVGTAQALAGHRDLDSLRADTLHRLAMAAEYRDDNTHEHTERVGALAARLAAGVGLGDVDVALVRRAAVALELAASRLLDPATSLLLAAAAHEARIADADNREFAESDLSRALRAVVGQPGFRDTLAAREDGAALLEELDAAVRKVAYARSFYNNAVTATRAARRKLLPRALHLAGRAPLPEFFEIDDALPETSADAVRSG
jgi:hypothetical protein